MLGIIENIGLTGLTVISHNSCVSVCVEPEPEPEIQRRTNTDTEREKESCSL